MSERYEITDEVVDGMRFACIRHPGASKRYMLQEDTTPGKAMLQLLADLRERARHAADYIQGVVTE